MVKLLILCKNTLIKELESPHQEVSQFYELSREHLKEKAPHSLFSLTPHTNLSKLKTSLACKAELEYISACFDFRDELLTN